MRCFFRLFSFILFSASLFAADETIIPGKLSWSIDSIEEIWTVDVSQTTSEKTSKLFYTSTDETDHTVDNDGTSVDSAHGVKGGASVDAKAGIHVTGNDILLGMWANGIYADAEVRGYAGYDYQRHRKYWQSTDRTVTSVIKTRSEDTRHMEEGETQKRYNRRLRVYINFFNASDDVLSMLSEGRINVYLGYNPRPLGYASPTVENDSFLISSDGERVICDFEMPLNDSQKLTEFDSKKFGQPVRVDVAKGQLQIRPESDPAAKSLLQNTSTPFTVEVIHPEGVRQWDIRPVQKQPCTISQVLKSINAHCEHDTIGKLPVCFNCNDKGLISVNEISVLPQKGAEKYILLLYNGEPTVNDEKFFEKIPEKNDRITFVVLDACLLTVPLSPEHPARELLRICRPTLEQWKANGIVSGDSLPFNLAETPEELFAAAKTLAEQGDGGMQGYIAVCYEKGKGVSKDEAEAVKWYRKAAEQENTDAQWRLGFCYQLGIGVSQDEAEAVKWYQKAAEQGNADAQDSLGFCYQLGIGVSQDEAEAVELYRKAAEQGNAVAQWLLGDCYERGIGVSQDEAEAVKWYRKAAEQGNADAQCRLGNCYRYGKGVSKDNTEAVKWYRKAAEQGYAIAQCRLGYCYEDGIGVSKDEAEAVKWYRKAAEQGNADGQWCLGDCYRYGKGVSQDVTEAVEWYRKAAEQGNADAQWRLGVCYRAGIGVSQDEAEAVEWYRKAAEQGNADAQWRLGYCYENGKGISQDVTEAVEWYRQAAEQGNQEAKDALKRLGE